MIRVVSFYTRGAYQAESVELSRSAQRIGLDAPLLTVEQGPFASWHEAVCHKPAFILDCLLAIPRLEDQPSGVLWVDADARFRARPDWAILRDADFAALRFRWSPNHPWEILTGTLWCAKSPRMEDFLREWNAATERWKLSDRDTPEQHSLSETLARDQANESRLRFVELPRTWVWIEPEFSTLYPDERPVIAHTQASRRLKDAPAC